MFTMLQKIFISNKCYSFELIFMNIITKILSSTNVSQAPNHNIRMISEQSCNSEDWLWKVQIYHSRNKFHFNIKIRKHSIQL